MRNSLALVFIILVVSILPAGSSVQAHPADVYTHAIHLDLAQEGLSIEWEIKPGPMLVPSIWFEVDGDGDESVAPGEARAWSELRASSLSADLDGLPLKLDFDGLDFPSTRDAFQSGDETIRIHLSADWTGSMKKTSSLSLHNGMEETKSLNWYYITSIDGVTFRTPQQKNSRITFEVYPPGFSPPQGVDAITAWDSSMPSLSSWPGGKKDEGPAEPAVQQKAPQEILLGLVRQEEFSIGFYAFALGISLALGALHALTPGHGKTVVAAYLVGARGTTRHAIALGSVVTLTHTGSVFLLGVVTLAASQYILPTSIIPMLELLSGLLILGLGIYLLWQRFLSWRRLRAHKAAHARSLEHDHDHDRDHGHSHEHGHNHELPEAITWRSLIALGVSGGLVPCPDAIAILLVAVAINRILLGLALILSFSLGLAVVLIVIGLLMVNSRRLFERIGAFDRFAPLLPIVSAVVVLALGVGLTWGAYVRAKESGPPARVQENESKILYLAEDDGQAKQLFIAGPKGGHPSALTEGPGDVTDYAPSADGARIVYILQADDFGNELRLIDLGRREDELLADCENAICSQPAWSPDGRRVVYERMSLDAANPTGLSTLWWLELGGGAAQPVFPEDQLPAANPRWSPDGRWLSYANPESLRLYDLETGETHVVEGILGSGANWSPQGASILYRDVILYENQFITQLFRYDLDSRTRINVIPQPGFENILAAWSPDGAWVAAVRRDLSTPRGDQIWVMRPDGSEARQLTASEAVLHGSLNWSPDGDLILYDAYRLDSVPLESWLQVVEVGSGAVTDLGIGGYNPRWIRPE
jgi:ABC-type nickel/cobalt efflux system permease component RcnA/Tol biopolymer transport system component